MSEIKTITANSRDGGEVYRLLNLVHCMAGSLANSPRKEWQLASTNSNTMYGPILTVWTNGIVDIEARTWHSDHGAAGSYHEYTLKAVKREQE